LIIAVVADTHGITGQILARLEYLQPDCLLFAGDFYRDGEYLAHHLNIPAYIVSGNCDLEHRDQQEETVSLGGLRILLVHGHQYGVKQDLNRIYYRACELEVDIVVFAHTHQPWCEKHGHVWLVNPGSPSRPRVPGPGSFAIIAVQTGEIKPYITYLSALPNGGKY